ncbi:MAG: hypothetical protein WCG42_10365, partial [Parachlamydiaceae bacterium]
FRFPQLKHQGLEDVLALPLMKIDIFWSPRKDGSILIVNSLRPLACKRSIVLMFSLFFLILVDLT